MRTLFVLGWRGRFLQFLSVVLALLLSVPAVTLWQPMVAQAASPPPSTAAFVGVDMTTQGNWLGVYGKDGYVLPYYTATTSMGYDASAQNVAQLPSYVSGYSGTGTEWRTKFRRRTQGLWSRLRGPRASKW